MLFFGSSNVKELKNHFLADEKDSFWTQAFNSLERNEGEQQIKYDGTSFIVIGKKIYCCQFSQDKQASTKRK